MSFTVRDTKYESFFDACKAIPTNACTVRGYSAAYGVSLQSALNHYVLRKEDTDRPPYYVGEVKCTNRLAVANALGISMSALSKMITLRGGVVSAITFALSEDGPIATAKDLGVPLTSYLNLVTKFQSQEEAKQFLRKYPRVIKDGRLRAGWKRVTELECVIDGEVYYTLPDIASALGIDYRTLERHRRSAVFGSTMQDIVNTILEGS